MQPGDLQGIFPFMRAVEAGSFTAAAHRLHLTTSAIGKAIAQLERRLGVQLLHRTTRKLRLTSEGAAYYEACVNALSQLEAAQALLMSGQQRPSGRLRVDIPLALGRRCIMPVLLQVARLYSELKLEISFNDRRIDLVEEGIDLSVRVGDLPESPTLMARRLGTQRSSLFALPSYFERFGKPANIAELGDHMHIAYGRDGWISPWLVADGVGKPVKFHPSSRVVLAHGEPLLDAAIAGMGIAHLPTWLAVEALERGELEMVFPGRIVEGAAIHALWPATRSLSPKARVVIDPLVDIFSRPEWTQV
ncbi:LysR family transcriptional regulator [Inquilinus sp. OTU3971]|uniref:LysR family transcriptional regulator n=1 Tax=Inquilinus sp. OTU3971 TaxID=3043855 RepID=UPI00313DE668